MRVRAIDDDGDWLFGRGQNDYQKNVNAVAQNIRTRLQEFLGDSFFNMGAGIDWYNLLGSKDQTALNLAISSIILNTRYVTGIRQLDVEINESRAATITYQVQTSFGDVEASFSLDPTLSV